MQTATRNSEATRTNKNALTGVASMFKIGRMVRYADVEKRLEQQYGADAKTLKRNYARQNELLASVVEYNDLVTEARMREDRMRRVVELLGADEFLDTRKALLDGNDVSREISISVNDDSPLWESIRTILEQVPEVQIIDLQDALLHFGKKVTRQAIESALATHRETFATVLRSRDKFVSLKR
jgi:hypothetical protein